MKRRTEKPSTELRRSASVLGVLFILVFVLFVYMSWDALRTAIVAKPSLASHNQLRANFAGWPHVTGVLDEIDIVHNHYRTHSSSRTYDHDDYWPTVRYHYSVGNISYSGDCMRKDIVAYRDLSGNMVKGQEDPFLFSDPIFGIKEVKEKLAAFLPASLVDHVTRKDEKITIHAFFPSRSIAVYYDPKDPRQSMLDNHWQPLSWWDYYQDDILQVSFEMFIALIMLGALILTWCVSSIPDLKRMPKAPAALPEPIPAEEQWKVEKGPNL